MIARAENPLIITANAGRDEGDVVNLAALAEGFAIPVTQRKPRYMCLPVDHPMHLGFEPDAYLEDADLILVIDSRRAVDSQQAGTARRLQDHPYRRRSAVFRLSDARLSLRSRHYRRAVGDAAGARPKRWPAPGRRARPHRGAAPTARRSARDAAGALAGDARQGAARHAHSSGLDQSLPRSRDGRGRDHHQGIAARPGTDALHASPERCSRSVPQAASDGGSGPRSASRRRCRTSW